ncbi:MAG: radical SAM protein [Desulfobacterales bacterium]|nr:radical SAM protein [Desulfobacterales bacterium]
MSRPQPHPDTLPSLVYANRAGEIKDFPGLAMAGRSWDQFAPPDLADLIPLPVGSELFTLPDRLPVGIDPGTMEPLLVEQSPDDPKEGIRAVAAFMAPAHTAIHTAAFQRSCPDQPPLPLFAYTAVGWHNGRFWVSAFRSDPDPRQDADRFDPRKIMTRTRRQLKAHRQNRLIQHLGECCLTYGCPAARNYFLGRWEAPLPTSPTCNAGCVGCISLQPPGRCPSTQERIRFVPTAKEIAGVAVPHLGTAPRPVVSFGQGCEGEPLLQAGIIEQAIRTIREHTDMGTININTNAGLPEAVDRLADAGLDSIRVSMNSARPLYHRRYHRPRDFTMAEVRGSIRVMKKHRKFVSLNYFILPGFSDDPEELAALTGLIDELRPDLIQLRNLNMDPDWYIEVMDIKAKSPGMGIRAWHRELRRCFPNLRFGYFNPPLR